MPELRKAYISAEHEDRIRELWEQTGSCNPDKLPLPESAPSYTIIIPPPNVTDRLHLGHASMLEIEDLLIRYKRMNGFRTLMLPGTDHTAIATQTVVEKQLYKEEGKSRHDLGREAFFKRVHEYALETQQQILSQFRSVGASMDWSRLAFTLDEPRQKAVRQMFVDMYEAGAIYRGERIVNWCPHCQSTLADDEVEHKAQQATLYTFKYSADFPIAISTTRPETKLGDTAVAVNPKDERYAEYIGKTFTVDFVGQPLTIRIIGDREVDMAFGTGALGVTPAHSMVDWRMAEEQKLPIIKVIDEQGNIRPEFGEYGNTSVAEARSRIVEKLREAGLIEKEEEIENNLSVCYRCGTPIEPLPSQQWFVAVDKPLERLGGKSLKQAAYDVAEDKSITFVPERFEKRYKDWMSNLRDWCISRQIWFGHQIPVWYKGDEIHVGLEAPAGEEWKQDSDTLDTWFSSGMWTFSTLGWPEHFKNGKKTGDLARFHPTDVLETGYEIITLWVSRMIMMSLLALNEIPFKTVYLHGMVLDKDGKKMSKSKGNGIDPTVVGAEYGMDAVRLSVLVGNTPGIDVRVSEEKIAGLRNLVNKLWNISRYILSQPDEAGSGEMSMADRWIVSRLNKTIASVSTKIEQYDFSAAGEELRAFTLDDLADWYLEASKFEPSPLKPKLLKEILNAVLRLWHPFMPFVTEAIWQAMKAEGLLMVASWPKGERNNIDETAEASFNRVRDVIVAIRNLRSEHRLPPGEKVTVRLYAPDHVSELEAARALISGLRTGIGSLEISAEGPARPNDLYANVSGVDIYIEVTVDVAAERARLEKEISKLEQMKSSIEARLNNEEFKAKAPANIIVAEEKKRDDYSAMIKKMSSQLDQLAS